jgi:trehalose-phosphatase
MDDVEEVFHYFCDRTPFSFVEREKSYLSWHYRDCDPEFGDLQARDLLNHLNAGPLVNTSTEVVHSNKLVQVRPAGVSKGHTLEKVVQQLNASNPIGFILCLGNFLLRDEDVFLHLERRTQLDPRSPKVILSCLPEETKITTVTIGARASLAKNYVRNVSDVQQLLMYLAAVISKEPVQKSDHMEHKSSPHRILADSTSLTSPSTVDSGAL